MVASVASAFGIGNAVVVVSFLLGWLLSLVSAAGDFGVRIPVITSVRSCSGFESGDGISA